MAETTVRFADYELDFARRELRRGGAVVELQPTPRRVLLHLAEHRDRTVSRRELLDAVWPGVVVGDETLTRALAEIRRAVGDDGDAQRVIRTLKGEGYRFVAEVAPEPARAEVGGGAVADAVAAGADGAPRDATLGVRPQASLHGLRVWIAAGVSALAAAGVAGALWVGTAERPAEPAPQSQPAPFGVAVLPVANLSGDASDQPLADGLTEQITSQLAQNGYPVVARTTAAQWRERAADVRELGRQLGVSHVLEGSVQRGGERLRVTMQLIATHSGKHVWSEGFDEPVGEVLAIQDRVSWQTVFNVSKYVFEDTAIASTDPELAEIAELAIEARRSFAENRFQDHIAIGERLIEVTPEREPFLVLIGVTHGMVSIAWSNLYTYGPLPLADVSRPMFSHAEAAVSVAPKLGYAHTALARAHAHQWNWAAAEREMRRACELNPRSGLDCGFAKQHVCAALGCLDDLLDGMQMAERFSPAEPATLGFRSPWSLLLLNRADEAEAVSLRVFSVQSGGAVFLSDAQWRLGKRAEAVESWAASAAANGDPAGARELRRRLQESPEAAWRWAAEQQAAGTAFVFPNQNDFLSGWTYAELGDMEAALAALERSVAEHEPGMELFGLDPVFDPIRDTPRFRALIEKVGLTAYHAKYLTRPRMPRSAVVAEAKAPHAAVAESAP
jgi:TolB-like protein/DNA-binding winged helix-turn-helix (wHTH) protein